MEFCFIVCDNKIYMLRWLVRFKLTVKLMNGLGFTPSPDIKTDKD